ncbi:sugar phosphate isomerase/epimerase family protein [Halobacillus kuroshimensis]|uniref:sugar phosphate isomerase/epimerase family protein n=1 Tax=Halobacillus kuroshimensis TaxID=302481 RepID=UPI00041BF51E|nr:sugar phosphate isomerase/epimerase family protein [Halobacillus kuroshimensis]
MNQNYQIKSEEIKKKFLALKKKSPELFEKRLNLSWSNWGFGFESLEDSVVRLKNAGINYVELHGNHYGEDLGYEIDRTLTVLNKHDMKVSGVCGMFSSENDLSSNNPRNRQNAIGYIKREVQFTNIVGGHYLLVVPGAVGRPEAYDEMEFERSVATLENLGDLFLQNQIKAAIEPVRAAEVSFVHTVKDAQYYIEAVGHEGIQHINGDIYHMQTEETHIGEAIIQAGPQLTNLHLADSNRGALGDGMIDLDTIIMSLYLIGFNQEGKFVTPEPLGPGADPYPAMNMKPNHEKLEYLVTQTASYFRGREAHVLGL